VRVAAGREAEPSAGVADSQTVHATEQAGPRGDDGGKKITGVKRHVCVDTIGLVWGLAITTADVADCKGAHLVVTDAMCAHQRLVKIWTNSASQGFLEFAWLLLNIGGKHCSASQGNKGF
jgi:putative transposase